MDIDFTPTALDRSAPTFIAGQHGAPDSATVRALHGIRARNDVELAEFAYTRTVSEDFLFAPDVCTHRYARPRDSHTLHQIRRPLPGNLHISNRRVEHGHLEPPVGGIIFRCDADHRRMRPRGKRPIALPRDAVATHTGQFIQHEVVADSNDIVAATQMRRTALLTSCVTASGQTKS